MSDYDDYDNEGYDEDGDYDDEIGDDEEEDFDDEGESEFENESKENGNIKNDKKILGKKTKREFNTEDEFHKVGKKGNDCKAKDEVQDEYVEEESEENENDEEDEEEEDDDEENEDEEQDSYEYNCETGDIGEKIIHDDLRTSKNIGKIKWMNKKGESFKPYDFKFKIGNKTIYIDAKSTVFDEDDAPPPTISENEQYFIDNLEKNQRYYIARVYDARSDNPKIVYYNAKTMNEVNKSEVENGY